MEPPDPSLGRPRRNCDDHGCRPLHCGLPCASPCAFLDPVEALAADGAAGVVVDLVAVAEGVSASSSSSEVEPGTRALESFHGRAQEIRLLPVRHRPILMQTSRAPASGRPQLRARDAHSDLTC